VQSDRNQAERWECVLLAKFCENCGREIINKQMRLCEKCSDFLKKGSTSPVSERRMEPACAPRRWSNVYTLIIILLIVVIGLGFCVVCVINKDSDTPEPISQSFATTSPKATPTKKPTATPTSTPKSKPKPTPTLSPLPTPAKAAQNGNIAEELILDYSYALVDAINVGDFSLVEGYLLRGSELYNLQKKLVSALYEENQKETWVLIEVVDENWIDSETCYISTHEVCDVVYANGKKERITYDWTYTMVYKYDKFYLSTIKATN